MGEADMMRRGHQETSVVRGVAVRSPVAIAAGRGLCVRRRHATRFFVETGELVRGDVATQTRVAVKACLQAVDADQYDVVNVRIYCANSAWFAVLNQVYGEFSGPPFPTRTFVPVAPGPAEFDVEIDCVAFVPVDD